MKYYTEELKSPLWQKKRLEIMQRDNWTCQICKSTDIELNVHHSIYRKGLKPWEYENSDLITLCRDCHKRMHMPEYLQEGKIYFDDSKDIPKGYVIYKVYNNCVYVFGFDYGNTGALVFDVFKIEDFLSRCLIENDVFEKYNEDDSFAYNLANSINTIIKGLVERYCIYCVSESMIDYRKANLVALKLSENEIVQEYIKNL